MSHIGIIGGGAFGTALAIALGREGSPVTLWCRSGAAEMAVSRENARYLPGCRLPDAVTPISSLDALGECAALLLVLPAQQTASFLREHTLPDAPLVLCAKGVTTDGLQLQSELCDHAQKAVLTGPGFAAEIARGLPTALTLAAHQDLATPLQALLSRRHLRLYRSEDMIGAQLGGALKNVIAIAAGIAIGLGLGESARAAVITRGFAEMRRLAAAMGARDETLCGLSGLGDLTLTCGSATSRNFAHGLALGQGQTADAVTTEGVATARAAIGLAARHGIEMPIAQAVASVVESRLTVAEAMHTLLDRPQGKEE